MMVNNIPSTPACLWRFPVAAELLIDFSRTRMEVSSSTNGSLLPLAFCAYTYILTGRPDESKFAISKIGSWFVTLVFNLLSLSYTSNRNVCGKPPSKPALHSTLIDDWVWLLTTHSISGVGRPENDTKQVITSLSFSFFVQILHFVA